MLAPETSASHNELRGATCSQEQKKTVSEENEED